MENRVAFRRKGKPRKFKINPLFITQHLLNPTL
jgi:hypothetical protein